MEISKKIILPFVVVVIVFLVILLCFNRSSFSSSTFEFVDVIYYINLDHRTDRKEHFLNEMKRMNIPDYKIVRVPGVYKPGQGDWGCSLSHINAMNLFMNSGYSNCIIFEDDFTFTVTEEELNVVNLMKDIPFDVCMLASNTILSLPSEYPFLKKIINAQTTSGYMVSRTFGNVLLENFIKGAQLIEESYTRGKGDDIQGVYCIDQYWKMLQPISTWYEFYPLLGTQKEELLSDIQV